MEISQHRVTCRIVTALPSTRHKWTHPTLPQPYRPVLDLPTPEGWKAELT